MSEPHWDSGVGLRLVGMCGPPQVRSGPRITWYDNPLFEPEEGDMPSMLHHEQLPLKKMTTSVATSDTTLTTSDAAPSTSVVKKEYRLRPLKCPDCEAVFTSRYNMYNHRRRGRCHPPSAPE